MPAIIVLILFGVLQGLTEFLPVSSSGHLSLFQYFSKAMEDDLSLNIAVHIGTLFTILIYYRRDLFFIIQGFFKKEKDCVRMVYAIVIASIPTAILGLFMKKTLGWVLTSPLVSALCLLITGGILLLSDRIKVKSIGVSGFGINMKRAFVIGVVQGLAVLPGISRSGSTIVTGLYLGMSPKDASRFSFLVSLPAILGAGLLEFKDLDDAVNWTSLGVGALASFITGLVAISWMVKLTQKGQLRVFAYYVVALSIVFLSLYSFGLGENSL